jgi:hypothetical protein
MLGNGVTGNTTGGSQDITANNNSQIMNNVNVTANSGNASVTGNTNAGNATSGNTTASANILNVNMSNFSLSNWFGILFINVFGRWDGSFGVDTASGNLPFSVPPPANNGNTEQTSPPFSFGFVPHTSLSQQRLAAAGPVSGEPGDNSGDTPAAPTVLGATTDNNMQTPIAKATQPTHNATPFLAMLLTILLLGIVAATATALTRRNKLA